MSESSLRTIRRSLGLTQVDLADILGVTQAAVSKIETRDNQSLDMFIAMAKAKGYEITLVLKNEAGCVLDFPVK